MRIFFCANEKIASDWKLAFIKSYSFVISMRNVSSSSDNFYTINEGVFIVNYFPNQDSKLQKNVFHIKDGKTGSWVWKDEEYTSFPEIIVASNSDAQSTYADPKFKNGNRNDFRLRKGSSTMKIIRD
ncbi:hypothetical protein M3152_00080 [Sporosarcina luteola]|uniref:hypothetical protein n=1 Tax=Bacillales TaxID=1385 RepID=UPI00203CB955|nr:MULTISPECIES: hypothetical protein [Bacillales]MCM3636096.1 hypothetical protein [Sporosarcina luteola]